MVNKNWPNTRLLYYGGLGLIALAFALLPTRFALRVEGGPLGETEDMGVGWIITPVVLTWGFCAITLSAIENFEAKAKNTLRFIPALIIMYMILVYGAWMGIHYGDGAGQFWWLHFVLILVPVAIATIAMFLGVTERKNILFVSQKKLGLILATMCVIPILYSVLMLSWLFFALSVA
jgi:hypothetical protein